MDVHGLQCWDSSRGSPIPGFEATFPLDLPKLLDSSGSLQMRLRLLRCERSEGHPVFCRSGRAGESAGLQSRMQGLSIMINYVHCEPDHCHVAMEYSTLIVVWRFVYLEVENRWCITSVCINLCCILKGPKLDSSRFCGISRWRQLCADVAPRASGVFPGCLVHLVLARLLHTWHRKLGRPGGMVGSVHICPVHSTMSPAHQHMDTMIQWWLHLFDMIIYRLPVVAGRQPRNWCISQPPFFFWWAVEYSWTTKYQTIPSIPI